VLECLEKSSWIRKMFEDGAELKKEMGTHRVFDFSLGNPYGEPPGEFHEILRKELSSPAPGFHAYMPNAGYPETRDARARELSSITGISFSADNLVMTAGAAGGINIALKAILNPGEKVVIFSPYFVEYAFYIQNNGGNPLVLPTDLRFEPDIIQLEKNLSANVKGIILNSPNNPSGKVYTRETLTALGELLERFERETGRPIFVISDEPYREIVYDDVTFHPPAKYVKNCIVVYSHSKDLNIPGERIGYAAVSPEIKCEKKLFDSMVFANRTLGFVNAPALMQRASKELVGTRADHRAYRENRALLSKFFDDFGLEYSMPEGAFYFFPKVPFGETDLSFTQRARDEGILVVPGRGFGLPEYFRVAYCTPPEVVKRSRDAWERLLSKRER
jgi:aspartate aminotransferase